MLVRLLYVSRALDPESGSATQSILDSARKYNAANGITGILCYGGGLYLQAVEGGRTQVNGSLSTATARVDATRAIIGAVDHPKSIAAN